MTATGKSSFYDQVFVSIKVQPGHPTPTPKMEMEDVARGRGLRTPDAGNHHLCLSFHLKNGQTHAFPCRAVGKEIWDRGYGSTLQRPCSIQKCGVCTPLHRLRTREGKELAQDH